MEDIWKLNPRYGKMLEVITHADKEQGVISVLDVGCGWGDGHGKRESDYFW